MILFGGSTAVRMSRLHAPTLKETPAEAETRSHQLLLRAGMMRKVGAGIYTFLPLGWRVVQKVAGIVREEMNRAGAQEIFMPTLSPAELWQESGRWSLYGKEMMRLTDRHEREFALGPTHEEVVTDLVRHEVRSYRQLPINLYQIQTKFRDEVRPRFGLMRAREFIMKDAYSFHRDEECLDREYQSMYKAYTRIFTRTGLTFRAVEADTGSIGGSSSHEFMVLADSGEEGIAFCDACGYAANVEKAAVLLSDAETSSFSGGLPCEKVATPDVRTIDEVSAFLKLSPDRFIKTLVYLVDGKDFVMVLMRGNDQLNEIKLKNALKAETVFLASDEDITSAVKAERGFLGPVGIKTVSFGAGIRKVVADQAVARVTDGVTGANEKDYHLLHVAYGRDFKADQILDLRTVITGDSCPRCSSGKLDIRRGIEVGHVFKLGTKYSAAMHAGFLDEDGTEKTMIMGCYGIGVTRTMAAAVEQNNDEDGIIWPVPIAPYQVLIVPLFKEESEEAFVEAERIYQELTQQGVECLLDDRPERPGVKFKDADLIGVPLRLTVGAKGLAEGIVELRDRRVKNVEKIARAEVVSVLKRRVDEALRAGLV